MRIVQKFGGSSLADPEGLRRAAALALAAQQGTNAVITVVSAMGDTTDKLGDLARRICPSPPEREMDALLSTGELQSAALLAIMLSALGGRARSCSGAQAGIHSSGAHGSAEILHIDTDALRPILEDGQIAVVAGFQAQGPDGSVCTLGRGGSDTSAVALAAAFQAERCEIYTDVDGIYSADPRMVEDAVLLPRIDFRDMLRLSRCGSQVLHGPCVQLAMDHNLPIRLLSSFHPGEGSLVCFVPEGQRPAVAGITRDREKNTLSVVGRGVDGELLPRLARILAGAGMKIRSVSCGAEQLSLELRPEHLHGAVNLIHSALFHGR